MGNSPWQEEKLLRTLKLQSLPWLIQKQWPGLKLAKKKVSPINFGALPNWIYSLDFFLV